MSGTATKVLAVVGFASLVYMGGKSAATAVLENISTTVGTPSIDASTSPIGANGEVYVRVDLPITIENKNSFALHVDYFSGRVSYGNITLSEVSPTGNIHIPANSNNTIVVNVDVPTRRVFQDVQQAIQNGNILDALINKILFNGKVKVSAIGQSIIFPLENIPIPIT